MIENEKPTQTEQPRQETTLTKAKCVPKASVPFALKLAACHFGALGALLSLNVKLADNGFPHSWGQDSPSLEGFFRTFIKAAEVLFRILALPLIPVSYTHLTLPTN